MTDFLLESGYRSMRPAIVTSVMVGSKAKYEQDQRTMLQLVDESERAFLYLRR